MFNYEATELPEQGRDISRQFDFHCSSSKISFLGTDYTDKEMLPPRHVVSDGNIAECFTKTLSPTDYFKFKLCVPSIDSLCFSIFKQNIVFIKGE